MAVIIPFPIDRRQPYIERQAHRAAELSPDASERYIAHQLRLQRDAMFRKGIDESLIERELRCLDISIRKVLFRELHAGTKS